MGGECLGDPGRVGLIALFCRKLACPVSGGVSKGDLATAARPSKEPLLHVTPAGLLAFSERSYVPPFCSQEAGTRGPRGGCPCSWLIRRGSGALDIGLSCPYGAPTSQGKTLVSSDENSSARAQRFPPGPPQLLDSELRAEPFVGMGPLPLLSL